MSRSPLSLRLLRRWRGGVSPPPLLLLLPLLLLPHHFLPLMLLLRFLPSLLFFHLPPLFSFFGGSRDRSSIRHRRQRGCLFLGAFGGRGARDDDGIVDGRAGRVRRKLVLPDSSCCCRARGDPDDGWVPRRQGGRPRFFFFFFFFCFCFSCFCFSCFCFFLLLCSAAARFAAPALRCASRSVDSGSHISGSGSKGGRRGREASGSEPEGRHGGLCLRGGGGVRPSRPRPLLPRSRRERRWGLLRREQSRWRRRQRGRLLMLLLPTVDLGSAAAAAKGLWRRRADADSVAVAAAALWQGLFFCCRCRCCCCSGCDFRVFFS